MISFRTGVNGPRPKSFVDGFGSNVYVYAQSELVGERSSLHGYVVEGPGGKFSLDLQVNNPVFPEDTAATLLNNLIARTN